MSFFFFFFPFPTFALAWFMLWTLCSWVRAHAVRRGGTMPSHTEVGVACFRPERPKLPGRKWRRGFPSPDPRASSEWRCAHNPFLQPVSSQSTAFPSTITITITDFHHTRIAHPPVSPHRGGFPRPCARSLSEWLAGSAGKRVLAPIYHLHEWRFPELQSTPSLRVASG